MDVWLEHNVKVDTKAEEAHDRHEGQDHLAPDFEKRAMTQVIVVVVFVVVLCVDCLDNWIAADFDGCTDDHDNHCSNRSDKRKGKQADGVRDRACIDRERHSGVTEIDALHRRAVAEHHRVSDDERCGSGNYPKQGSLVVLFDIL